MKVLEVSNPHKKFGKKEIIKGVDFFIEEGEIFGLLGPNGIGKTTVIKMIVGFLNADEGSVLIMGKDSKLRNFPSQVPQGCKIW